LVIFIINKKYNLKVLLHLLVVEKGQNFEWRLEDGSMSFLRNDKYLLQTPPPTKKQLWHSKYRNIYLQRGISRILNDLTFVAIFPYGVLKAFLL
jgi:hypothetical protein